MTNLAERYEECKKLSDGCADGNEGDDWFDCVTSFTIHAPKTFELLTEYRDLLVDARRTLEYYITISDSVTEIMNDDGTRAEETLTKLTKAIGEGK